MKIMAITKNEFSTSQQLNIIQRDLEELCSRLIKVQESDTRNLVERYKELDEEDTVLSVDILRRNQFLQKAVIENQQTTEQIQKVVYKVRRAVLHHNKTQRAKNAENTPQKLPKKAKITEGPVSSPIPKKIPKKNDEEPEITIVEDSTNAGQSQDTNVLKLMVLKTRSLAPSHLIPLEGTPQI